MASKINPESPRPQRSTEDTVTIAVRYEEKIHRLKFGSLAVRPTLRRTNFPA